MPTPSAVCIDACSACVKTSTACADACLAEKHMERLITCIRLNQDCAAVCIATGSIMSRANKVGHRQLLEAQFTTCIAFCRACAAECAAPCADMHKHCEVCAKACTHCANRLHRNADVDADAGLKLDCEPSARSRAAAIFLGDRLSPARADMLVGTQQIGGAWLRIEACGEIAARIDQVVADHRELDTGRQGGRAPSCDIKQLEAVRQPLQQMTARLSGVA